MGSFAFLFLCTCALLLAGGHNAATGAGHGLARGGELSLLCARSTGHGRVAEETTTLARRGLAARLGVSSKGSGPVKGAVHPEDAAALLKAAAQWKKGAEYRETVDDRKLLNTWDVKRPCSQWFGVTCDSATLRVTTIKLPRLGNGVSPFLELHGPFPAELGSLPELRSLILAGNQLGDLGTIPKTWARLGKLNHLDLSGNFPNQAESHPVPQALCSLTSLTYLNLAGTYLDSGLPKQCKGLTRLVWLDLSLVKLGAADIQILRSFTRVKSLFLRNSMDVKDIAGLSQLRGVELLDLSDYAFLETWDVFRPAVKGLTSVVDLRISSTFMYKPPPVPSWLGSLKQLTSLDLSGSGFKGSLPTQLGGLSRLARLLLQGNNLVGKVPQGILNTRYFTELDFAGNKLDFGGISFGPHAPSSLKKLDLSGNSFNGTIPKGLSSLTRLNSLLLSSNLLLGTVPQFLWTMRSLTKLDLSNNSLTGLGVSSPQKAAVPMKSLDLSYNKLRGSISSTLSTLRSLTSLSVAKNQLTGTIPSWLGALKGLVLLSMRNNHLTGSIPQGLGAIKGLAFLSLRKNQLTGSIPAWLGASKGLQTLTLSNNQLTGSIPAGLGKIKGLGILSLDSNQLTGSLPGSIFRATLNLNVANNRLSGNLPAQALSLFAKRFLDITSNHYKIHTGLDVSGNYLTGPCYSSSHAWVDNSSILNCWADLDVGGPEQCYGDDYDERAHLKGNCLQGCFISGLDDVDPNWSPLAGGDQRSDAQCSRFCGADKRNGPCNGHGSCSLKGPKKTPTCTCKKGFVTPASKPGTCVASSKMSL